MNKIDYIFGGVETMKTLPDIVIFIGQPGRSNPLKECKKLGITTIALVDTNSNPEFVDLPIPANDQSIPSIKVILKALSYAICAGHDIRNGVKISPTAFMEKQTVKQELLSYLPECLSKKLSQSGTKELSKMEFALVDRALIDMGLGSISPEEAEEKLYSEWFSQSNEAS